MRIAVEGGTVVTVAVARPLGSPVTIALRPEAVTVEPLAAADGAAPANTADAVVEQIVYHGFVSHLYLRRRNGEPLIAFQQNQGNTPAPALAPGVQVRACWAEASNRIVRE